MTTWMFWQDAYQKEFDAKVLAINDNGVVLDQTCFYPAGGGQIFDTGEINGSKIIEVRKDENDTIYHKIEGQANFNVGDSVHGKIDWDRRHNIMKLPTARH